MDYSKRIEELLQALKKFFEDRGLLFDQFCEDLRGRLQEGGKILIFGNGGSAAQAQHFAAELVNKFLRERPAIPCLSLTTDTSALTSIANDVSFDEVFSRQVEALGRKGDVALGLTTSGNSPNVVKAILKAQGLGLLTAALTGEAGGQVGPLTDYCLDVPSRHTPLIQEVHLVLLHFLAEEIEKPTNPSG